MKESFKQHHMLWRNLEGPMPFCPARMGEVQKMSHQIYASYDEKSIIVYQAFRPETVAWAVEHRTFGKGFGLDRMTWIKPSFGWMLYRSGYARKSRQDAIAKIHLSHVGFLSILKQSIETSFDPDIFATNDDWRRSLAKSEVRHQWDPERNLKGGKLERRAIQIGISGETVRRYVQEWILAVEDVTELAHDIELAVKQHKPLPEVPEERVYTIEEGLARRLGCKEGR